MKNTGLEDDPDDLNLGNPRQAVPVRLLRQFADRTCLTVKNRVGSLFFGLKAALDLNFVNSGRPEK
jgi:hypothetical protein